MVVLYRVRGLQHGLSVARLGLLRRLCRRVVQDGILRGTSRSRPLTVEQPVAERRGQIGTASHRVVQKLNTCAGFERFFA